VAKTIANELESSNLKGNTQDCLLRFDSSEIAKHVVHSWMCGELCRKAPEMQVYQQSLPIKMTHSLNNGMAQSFFNLFKQENEIVQQNLKKPIADSDKNSADPQHAKHDKATSKPFDELPEEIIPFTVCGGIENALLTIGRKLTLSDPPRPLEFKHTARNELYSSKDNSKVQPNLLLISDNFQQPESSQTFLRNELTNVALEATLISVLDSIDLRGNPQSNDPTSLRSKLNSLHQQINDQSLSSTVQNQPETSTKVSARLRSGLLSKQSELANDLEVNSVRQSTLQYSLGQQDVEKGSRELIQTI